MNKKYEHIHVPGQKFSLMDSLIPYRKNIQAKIDSTEYRRNVFIMIKFREHNKLLRKFIISTLKEKGFRGIIADMPDWRLTKDNVINPIAVLYCCKYGIAIFDEPEDNQFYNPNVAYELGIMHYQHKNCLILIRDEIKLKKPFDLLSRLHETYKDNLEIEHHIKQWIDGVLSMERVLTKRSERKVVVAVVRKKNNKYLLTRRKEKEGNLEWAFPAKNMSVNTDARKALPTECFSETGITPRLKKKIGERIHPDTNRLMEYWLCDYESGRKKVNDPAEIEEVEWVSGRKAQELITSDIYEPVLRILNGRN